MFHGDEWSQRTHLDEGRAVRQGEEDIAGSEGTLAKVLYGACHLPCACWHGIVIKGTASLKLNFHTNASGLTGSLFEYVCWEYIILKVSENVFTSRCLQIRMILKEIIWKMK